MNLRLPGNASECLNFMFLHFAKLPWFVWTAAALIPLGTIGYVVKFYSTYWRFVAVWKYAALLTFFQLALFLASFAFIPPFAFILNIVALPYGYYLFGSTLERVRIDSTLGSKTLPGS